jgi:hypothetical protein
MFGLTGGFVPCGPAVMMLLPVAGRPALLGSRSSSVLDRPRAHARHGGPQRWAHSTRQARRGSARHATTAHSSSVLILVLGVYVGYEGITALAARAV